MRLKHLLLAVLCAALVASPVAWAATTKEASASRHATASHRVTHTKRSRQAKRPRRAKRRRSLEATPYRGIGILWYRRRGESLGRINFDARRSMSYIRGLGGNAVSISFPFYTPGLRSNHVSAGRGTPSVRQLQAVIEDASRAQLHVTLRPLMDETDLPGGYRGYIKPRSVSKWFKSYEAFLRPYLKLAQRQRVGSFITGTEFSTLTKAREWYGFNRWARHIYHGTLVSDQNWNNQPTVGGAKVGYDAYPSVYVGNNASVGALEHGLKHWLATRHVRPSAVTLDEVGLSPQAGMYKTPWSEGFPGKEPLDYHYQARWYAAMCGLARSEHLRGIFFWYLDMNQAAEPSSTQLMDEFIGHSLSTSAIQACFKSL